MDFDTLYKLWPILTGILGVVIAVGILFYRVTAVEKSFSDMSTLDRNDHLAIENKVDDMKSDLNDIKLDIATGYVQKAEFNRILTRIEDKLENVSTAIIAALTKIKG